MSSTAGARGERGFARYAWVVLGYNLAAILWGAVAHTAGSDASCVEHWPFCQGQVIPHARQVTTVMEFAHWARGGIDIALVAGLVYLAFRRFARGDSVRRYATAAAFFTLTGGLIGAALALNGEIGQKISLGSVGILSLHLANTFLLLAALALTAWAASGSALRQTAPESVEAMAGKSSRLRLVVYGSGLVAMVIVAITGTIALFRAGSLAQALHWGFAAPISPIMGLRIIHPMIAFATGMYLLVLGAQAFISGAPVIKRLGLCLFGLVVVHLWVSVFSVLLFSHVWRQVLNLFTGDLIWIALVLLSAEALGWRRAALPVRAQLELAPATATSGR